MDTIYELLSKLDPKQFKTIMRHFSKKNPKMKIPGFSLIEKAPIKLIVNAAIKNHLFRKTLLLSVAEIIVEDKDFDITSDISSITQNIPQTQWLGIAALLLLDETTNREADVSTLINGYVEHDSSPVAPTTPGVETKPDKKEEKFREKYMQARNEISDLESTIANKNAEIQQCHDEITELLSEKDKIENQLKDVLIQMAALTDENRSLRQALDEQKNANNEAQSTSDVHVLMSVFAPDCADILDKYEHSIRFVYSKEDCPSVEKAKMFDEIWIFENVLTFSTRRLLRNWENELGNKIRVFHSANEMVVYTKNIININGEK